MNITYKKLKLNFTYLSQNITKTKTNQFPKKNTSKLIYTQNSKHIYNKITYISL